MGEEWARRMQEGTWGDNTSLFAMCRILGRPFAVWRSGSDQVPTILAPPTDNTTLPNPFVYLELDERRPGLEHYSALLPQPQAMAKDLTMNFKPGKLGIRVNDSGCVTHITDSSQG